MGGGRSLGLTLPIEIMRKLRWRERQKVVVKLRGRKIIIEDWPVLKLSTNASSRLVSFLLILTFPSTIVIFQ